MNRREAITLSVMAALGVATTATACPSKQCLDDDASRNRKRMSPKDSKNLTKGEKKHTPSITVGKKDANGYTSIEITVGQDDVIHPSTATHWIDFIKLHADNKLVGISTLEAEISRGAASFSVKLNNIKTLTATSGCNLHGVWTSTTTL